MNFFDVDDQILPEPLREELAKCCRFDPSTRSIECFNRDYILRKIVKHYQIPVSEWKLFAGTAAISSFLVFFLSFLTGKTALLIYSFVVFSILIASLSFRVSDHIAKKTIYQRQIDNTIVWFNKPTSPLKEIPGFLDWKKGDILKMNDNNHKHFISSQYEYKGVLDDNSIVVQGVFGSGGTRGSKISYPVRFLKYNLYKNNSLQKREKEKREYYLEKKLEQSDFDKIVQEVRNEIKQKA